MSEIIDGVEYMSGDEVAALLGVKKATLYAYVSRGLLQSYRQAVGRRRLYRRDDIERLRTVRPEQAPQGHTSLPDAESWAGDH
jgi:excisionase family DNA binding protein